MVIVDVPKHNLPGANDNKIQRGDAEVTTTMLDKLFGLRHKG